VLSAELDRIDGHWARAVDLFEQAIAFARQTGSVQNEALANERCARLWLDRRRHAVANAYFAEARRCYLAWGAAAKARDLEVRYGTAGAERSAAVATVGQTIAPGMGAGDGGALDLSTVLKAARAIAVEVELADLLRKLMRIALENAGAERGVFLQDRDGRLFVEAEATAGSDPVTLEQSIPLEQAVNLSQRVVLYVRRTGHGLAIDDAATDERLTGDPYVERSGCKSILCVPVVHQGRFGGILYLENNLTTGAFTSRRVEMMEVLAAEAAIALDNAQLYEGLRQEVERRSHAETALRRALAEVEDLKNHLQAENTYLQEEIRTQHNFQEIVGNSPALLAALRQVERVAPTDSTVLVFGETGTGKELFARAIHSRSPRSGRPLVKVNCGAIAPGLVESELFGHVKGAFTGAHQNRTGRFELADRGTIFLDEVSELPLETQVKLLRVLQEQEFEPVGSSRTVRVNVRVIAASNRKLEDMVRAGRFRSDLLYRLNVFPLEVPPLRARRSDIPLLVAFFITRLAKRLGKPLEGASRRTVERLMGYGWPGNVRELENVVERAAILSPGPLLEVESDLLSANEPIDDGGRTLEELERRHIGAVLKRTRGVIDGPRGAAVILGLHPNTLRSRMKRLGVNRVPDGR
jgi:transcriptional regulator with GAF, ATPase, and Fis domain